MRNLLRGRARLRLCRERVWMPDDKAGAIPNLKAIEGALALGRQRVSPRDRIFVREPGWQHLEAGKMSVALEIALHESAGAGMEADKIASKTAREV
jgi:hypothetical protein